MSLKKEKRDITSNMVWHLAEKWGCQFVSFLVTIIISRQLDPSVYGVVAITTTFISVFSVFIDGGLGNALIQKKDADEVDFSTVFYANSILCLVVYLLLFLSAPLIARFYNLPELVDLIRVLGIIILVSGLKNIQQTYVAKNMIFKKFFFSSLTGTIVSGIVGIYLAIKGYGSWALVYASLTDVIVDTVFMWFSIRWRPKKIFSFDRLKELFGFGSKVLIATFIDRVYNKMYHLSIGKYCPSSDLAYYEKGYSITSKIADNTNTVISSVLFPAMSNSQDEKEKVKDIAENTLKVNTYVITPLLAGLMAICYPLVKVVLTDKWLPAVIFIRIFCLINILVPFDTINVNVTKSMGKSDILLKQEVMIKIICVVILAVSLHYGALAVVIGKLLSVIVGIIIKSNPTEKLINYSLFEQLKDTSKIFFANMIMAFAVYSVSLLNINIYLLLFVQIILGVVIYVLLSYLLKLDSFDFVLNYVKKINKA